MRVYGDLGYWDELAEGRQDIKDKIARVLATDRPNGGTVADRVMYGSDWLMLSQESGWQSYGEGIAAVIRGLDGTGALATKVLGGNVLRCYGLTKTDGRGRLDKLVKFHNEHGAGGAPGWVQA